MLTVHVIRTVHYVLIVTVSIGVCPFNVGLYYVDTLYQCVCHVAIGASDSEADDVSEAIEQSVTRASSTEPTSKVPLPVNTHTYAVHVCIMCVIFQIFL